MVLKMVVAWSSVHVRKISGGKVVQGPDWSL